MADDVRSALVERIVDALEEAEIARVSVAGDGFIDREKATCAVARVFEEGAEELEARAVVEEASRVRAVMEAADARILESGDALIVRLLVPITVGGEKHERLTLGPVRVRHVRAARRATDNATSSERYADQLLIPAGALDEIACEDDYLTVARAVERQLGKYREGGRPS